jgi:ribonuclease HI
MWNVGGEIWAVLAGLDYAISKYNPKNISLYYDYIGLGKWVNGEWKTKNPTTSAYARYVNNILKERPIEFNNVRGHSNILLKQQLQIQLFQ